MASYGQSLTVTYLAWDTGNHVGKTGDVTNHTLRLVKDGTSAAPTNSPAEVDSTNAPGVYSLVLTAAEAQHNVVVLCGKSSTSGIVIIPLTITFEQLPTAAPNANGGLPILSSSATTLAYTISTLTTYTGNTPQTGDSYARLGAPAGASVSADVAAVKSDTGTILTDVNTGAGAIYTRLGAPAGASISADIAAVKFSMGSPLQAGNVTVGGYASGQGPAALVLDTAASGHNTAGTIGAAINSAGVAGDPLANPVPGTYAQGTAGFALGRLGTAQITVSSIVAQSGAFTIVQGCDYNHSDGTAIDFTEVAGWPDLTAALSVQIKVFAIPGSPWTAPMSFVTQGGSSQKVRLELTATQTATMPGGPFGVFATLANGHVVELVSDDVTVVKS